jgi:hypothetical protein
LNPNHYPTPLTKDFFLKIQLQIEQKNPENLKAHDSKFNFQDFTHFLIKKKKPMIQNPISMIFPYFLNKKTPLRQENNET